MSIELEDCELSSARSLNRLRSLYRLVSQMNEDGVMVDPAMSMIS
jgi:hypothetical protein